MVQKQLIGALMGVCLLAAPVFGQGYALRFYGHGVNAPDLDRVKIRIDDPATTDPGPPADVGATDFTLEFWMKAMASANTAGPVSCGFNIDWIYGNIVFDRDRFSQDRKFGLSIAGGVFVWGVTGDERVSPFRDRTICGTTNVLDAAWHHVAVQRRRSDGWLWLYVDGILEAEADGPDGDVSYPDDGTPGPYCDGPCVNSDPFWVIGAEKHDAGAAYPSFNGWLDEVRLSTQLRYTTPTFPLPTGPFTPDAGTAALYHFDEGSGTHVIDSAGGLSPGERRWGGTPAGPVYTTDTPFVTLTAAPTLLLSGAFDAGTMHTDLTPQIPLPQPYSAALFSGTPMAYAGTEEVPALSAAVVDWVLVELRAAAAGPALAVRAALLTSSGAVVDLEGAGPVRFEGIPPGFYYLLLRHRNHLPVMSAAPVDFTSGAAGYDFTTGQAQAYGGQPMQMLGVGQYGLWGGDGTANGQVTAFDFVQVWLPENGGPPGYTMGDFNLNTQVTAFDFVQVWLPANGTTSQVPE